jgi:hypothetical protein
MSFPITIVSCVLLVTLVFNIASAVACLLIRIPVTEFGMGYGRKLLQFRHRSCRFSLGALPTGGFVAFDLEALNSRSLLQRLFVVGFGSLATILSGLLILGINLGLHYFGNAFTSIISGALDPLGTGKELVQRFADLSDVSFVKSLGVFFMVASAYNLIPARVSTGGRLLAEVSRSWFPARIARVCDVVGLTAVCLLTIAWAVAIIAHFL